MSVVFMKLKPLKITEEGARVAKTEKHQICWGGKIWDKIIGKMMKRRKEMFAKENVVEKGGGYDGRDLN